MKDIKKCVEEIIRKIRIEQQQEEQKKEEDDEEKYEDYCWGCNGSGEGMYDGSSCGICGGSGALKIKDN